MSSKEQRVVLTPGLLKEQIFQLMSDFQPRDNESIGVAGLLDHLYSLMPVALYGQFHESAIALEDVMDGAKLYQIAKTAMESRDPVERVSFASLYNHLNLLGGDVMKHDGYMRDEFLMRVGYYTMQCKYLILAKNREL